jgi:YVTN family beta-propeller protein
MLLAGLLLAAAASVAIVGTVVLTGDDAPSVAVRPNTVAVIDPATNEVVDAVQVGLRPGPITAGPIAIWVGNLDDRNLTRIDGGSRRPAGTVDLGGRTPTGLAFDRGAVWAAHGRLGSVSVVDARFGDVAKVVDVTDKGAYSSAGSITAGAGGIWAVFGGGTLAGLEPETGEVTATARTDASPAGVADGYGWVWVVSAGQSTVQRFDRSTLDEVGSLTVSGRPAGIAAASGDVWVTSEAEDVVYRIDVGGRSIGATIPVGKDPTAIASGAASLWVANTGDGTVSRIDPDRNEAIETIELGGRPAGLVVARNLVWVTVQAP